MNHVTALQARKSITRNYEVFVQCKRDLDLHYDGMRVCDGDSLEQYLVVTTSLLIDSRDWAHHVKAREEPPGIDLLREFLEQQITPHQTNSLSARRKPGRAPPAAQASNRPAQRNKPAVLHVREASNLCPACGEPHKIYVCSSFKGWSLEKKLTTVRQGKLYSNCLGKLVTVPARGHAESALDAITR